MRQRFSASGPLRYLGSEPLQSRAEAERAGGLARRAVDAISRAAGGDTPAGWVGVDMILGARDDGRADRVLEVNPRLTTSFVRLAAGSPRSLVRAMLDAAAVKPGELVIDLGSGDGRIPIVAARNYGARARGIEYNPDLVTLSRENARKAGVAEKVEFIEGDIFKLDHRLPIERKAEA